MDTAFIDCSREFQHVIAKRSLRVPADVWIHRGDPDERVWDQVCQSTRFLVVANTVVPQDFIETARNLNAIVFLGERPEDYLDLGSLKQREIDLVTLHPCRERALAERAVALILATAYSITDNNNALRAGNSPMLLGRSLRGLRLVVLSSGGYGNAVAEMASALGLIVSAFDLGEGGRPKHFDEFEASANRADIVYLHMPSDCLEKPFLGRLLRGAPTARYILAGTDDLDEIDLNALRDCLENGRIASLGLEVTLDDYQRYYRVLSGYPAVTFYGRSVELTEEIYMSLWNGVLEQVDRLRGGRFRGCAHP
jgi:D-3-phosphoglycerate dehydrogenase